MNYLEGNSRESNRRALAVSPDIILLMNLQAILDSKSGATVMHFPTGLAQSGKTIVMVTQ